MSVRPARRMARVAGAATVLVVALAVAGCATSTLDAGKLEQSITGDLTRAGLTGATVSCPADRPVRNGDAFTCTVTLAAGAGTLTYDVTQTSDNGEVAWKLAPGQLVLGTDVADELERKVAAESGSQVQVACPPSVLTPGGKGEIACTVDAGGDVVGVTVHVENGRIVTWDIDAPPGS